MINEHSVLVLRAWGDLGREIARPRAPLPVQWQAASRLIELAAPYFRAQVGGLILLLQKSDEFLKPLTDPFHTDFGAHRWLKGDREEAYSDWLDWIVQQLQPSAILDLFSIKSLFSDKSFADLEALPRGRLKSKREVCVPEGHPNQQGRLDLVIRFDALAVLVVEVKLGNADNCDTPKQIGYDKWLEQQTGRKYRVLVATSGDKKQYDGHFLLLRWSKVCLALRCLAVELAKKQTTLAAMMLAFVGAVEQNLLGISIGPAVDVDFSRCATFDPKIISHLKSCINAEEWKDDTRRNESAKTTA